MSVLTKNERDGLEEVFLSINSHRSRYQKLKEISSLIMKQQSSIDFNKLLKQAKHGIKEAKKSNFILNITKKKKNLSK
ncbi:hypothetical protein GJV85_10335 [Sulfurimonas aquatica]|uniref:Uncharacterized protein n=1 Tax=Sulfurimonas aquatica TaxID=2672570 RepID=A0A975B1M9_9BACT|nr:hypothetical protein [Sulfurimonas aquatica]QSZ42490.1 hypothetical protein GJV85_10335 [Sulfurimonas aquatica]